MEKYLGRPFVKKVIQISNKYIKMTLLIIREMSMKSNKILIYMYYNGKIKFIQ